jgi:O-succinylbenzoate synthase
VTIVRARLFAVALPLREPFTISGGTMAVRKSLIVELTDSQGNRGYGESAPFELPFYSSETIASARACLVDLLLPSVINHRMSVPADCRERLAEVARGNRMAKAGVETAWWDLCAAHGRTSLAALVGRRLEELGVSDEWRVRRGKINCGVALGIPPGQDGAVLREWVRDALGRGYRRVKIKIRPGWDEEPVRIARSEIQRATTPVPLWVDANGAYELERDQKALRALDDLELLFIEQPLAEEALWDSVVLARTLGTPICFDETLVSDELARQIIEMGGPRIWNIKIQRVGGLEEACRIYARAVRSGVSLWGGTMPETGLGAQSMLALGDFAGFVYPSDIEPSERWYEPGADLVRLGMSAEGTMTVPSTRPQIDIEKQAVLVAEVE